MYHFKADKPIYIGGKIVCLIYKHNKMNAKILSDIQYFKYVNNVDFKVIELNKQGIINY
jgi:hypothetical protein